MESQTVETLTFEYIFTFPDGEKKNYKIEIDKGTKNIICSSYQAQEGVYWSDLGFYQCSNCPLDPVNTPKCPVALNLQSVIEVFSKSSSIDEVDVEVRAHQRTYKKTTTLQYGLQALFGLLMASSGCPNLKFLSPMALFHMPFADVEETLLRSASFYLMSQFFKKLENKDFDFSLEGLKGHYKEVEKVNKGILARIRAVDEMGEASQNAIIILNAFAQMFEFQHEYDLWLLKYIFKY